MNLIVKFPSAAAREAFVAQAREALPSVVDHVYLGQRRPDAVIEGVTEAEGARIRELAEGSGEVFGDVQFETMSPR